MEKITSNDNHNSKKIEIIVKQYNREKRNNNNHNKNFNNRRNDKKSNWSSNENNINSHKNDLQAKSMEKKEILIWTRDCPVKRDGNIFCLKLPALKELTAFKDRSWRSLQINDLRKYFR